MMSRVTGAFGEGKGKENADGVCVLAIYLDRYLSMIFAGDTCWRYLQAIVGRKKGL